jgi:hypothetical protein
MKIAKNSLKSFHRTIPNRLFNGAIEKVSRYDSVGERMSIPLDPDFRRVVHYGIIYRK